MHPYQTLFRVSLVLSTDIFLFIPVCILLPDNLGHGVCGLVLSLAIILGPAAVILLPIFFFAARRGKKEIEGLKSEGGHWAHWEYNYGEWEAFRAEDWKRAEQYTRRYLASYAGACPLVILLVLFFRPDVSIKLATVAGIVPSAFLVSFHLFNVWRTQRDRQPFRPREAYIGQNGVLYDGSYTVLRGFGRDFKVKMEGRPAYLCFCINDYSVRTTNLKHVHVLVPDGREQEAEDLVRRFAEIKRSSSILKYFSVSYWG